MPVLTRPTTTPAPSVEMDALMHNLIRSLELARSLQMTLLERMLEMSLIELGQTIAVQEKSTRDQGLN